MKSILFMLALAACGGKQAPSPIVDNATTADDKATAADKADNKAATGKEGDVCHIGRHHAGSAVAVACGPGLSCCYPCGIDGCDSVCMTTCPEGIP